MTTFRMRGLLAAAMLSLVLAPLGASSPKYFQAETQADFLKGELENLAVDATGRLVLGAASTLVYETPAPFLWSIVAQPDGSLFIGTGNEGKVYRVAPDGTGSVFFDSGELEVHALALAPNGGLYAATSPDGKIYKIDRNGAATTFFDPEDKYIWSLASDARGNLYAGTGEKGVVYKIGPDGKGAIFYKSNATHVTALAVDRMGALFVGTGSPGRVLKVDADGKAFLVLDSPFQEIHTLKFDARGMLYAAAQSGQNSGGGGSAPTEIPEAASATPNRAPVPTVTVEVTSVAVADPGASSGAATTSRPSSGTAKGAVYRINPDGVWDQLWDSREDVPYDLTFDRDGAVIVGTGSKGKVYRLQGDQQRPTLLARANAQQVTAFYQDARGQLYFATANPGKVFRLGADRAARGTYESEARDANMTATWGALSWRGTTPNGSRIELFTRSGNTETPDDTWSAWSSAYATADGSPISSPKARYLQWRAVLTGGRGGDGPILTSVTAAYLQRNLRPQVRSVTVHPPGIVFQKPYSSGEPELAGFDDQTNPDRKLAVAAAAPSGSTGPGLGRRAYQKGLQTFVWRADDDNEDDLAYDVLYRLEGETTWKVLRRGMSETILVWDTASVPNGTYFIKVVASDSPSNPSDTALTGELESAAFEIDNTPPVLKITGVRVDRGTTIVSFDATDDHSPIKVVEFSQDGQRWRAAFPTDGIADSRSEHYELAIEGELSDRGLSIRATDAMNNVGTTHVDRPGR